MTGKCPHGFDHPAPAYPRAPGTAPRRRDSVKTRVIHDSRECPECLQLQIAEAHHILKRVFSAGEGLNATTYELWTHYLTRYNP